MKIVIISVGKKHDQSLVEAISEYTKRSSRFLTVEWKLIDSRDNEVEEGKAILNFINEKDFFVLLDETGKAMKSEELSALIGKKMTESVKRLVFVIGGSYGVSKDVKERADYVLSLSNMVFPHQLVRLIISEQIYRALSILNNGKYHHA